LSFKEQKEFETIDDEIANLEEALKNITVKIDEESSNFQLLPELLSEKEALEKQLEEKIERWAYLNELVEKINSNKKYIRKCFNNIKKKK
jgi:ATP-binding cassette subfamily F protein uup